MFTRPSQDGVFFDLFENISEKVVAAATALQDMARAFPNVADHIRQIRQFEHAADDLAHTALDRLDRTQRTPFDREDIHALIIELDDIVDSIDFLAKRFTLYHFTAIEQDFLRQSDVLVRAVTALHAVVKRLRTSRTLSEFTPDLHLIGTLEKEGDDNNHAAVSRLFSNSGSIPADPIEVMKWKEFYDRIEDAIDGCEDVGNTIERIVLKNG